MSKQKLKIKSSQIFGGYTDSIEKEYESYVEKIENGIKIVYDNNSITIIENTVLIENENSKMKIEKEKKNLSKYNTPYGVIDIEIEGKEIVITEGPILLKLSYYIKVGNTKEYINEVQISIAEK